MGGLVFTNSRAKLWRAHEQLQQLYLDMLAILNSEEHRATVEIDVKPYEKPLGVVDTRPWKAFTLYFSNAPRFTAQQGLLVGEVLHNFRASLDHLAWDLVRLRGRRRLRARKAERVAFPMARRRKNLVNSWEDKLPGVPRDPYFALVDWYQPYRRTEVGRTLKALRVLSDTDKHRIILPTAMFPEEGDLKISYEDGQLVGVAHHLKPGRPFKAGTQINTMVFADIGKKTKVKVEGPIKTRPIFPRSLLKPPPDMAAVGVDFMFHRIGMVCLAALNDFEAQP